MAYFRCTTGGSGKGNTLVVTCADELAGATITCTNGTKTYTKTCPSTSPYEVTFYGLEAGTYTVSATVSGNTFTTTVVVSDYEAELGGFSWKTWVDLSENYTSSDFTDLDDLLSNETAIRELMTIHDCVDYLAGIATENADVETIIGNDLCAKWINLRDYALDTLYANTIIKGYMDTVDKYFYGEWALMPQVPKMTSNTAPYGTVLLDTSKTASGSPTSDYYKLFSGTPQTVGVATNITSQYFGYDFTKPVTISRIAVMGYYGSGTMTLVVEGSADNATWNSVSESIPYENSTSFQYFDFTPTTYRYWRINATKGTSSSVAFTQLQFYAWQPKGNVPVMTSNTAPYGTASASTDRSGYEKYKAFDGDVSTFWWSTQYPSNSPYIEYDFVNPVCVRAIGIRDNNGASTVTIKGDNGDNTWAIVADDVPCDNSPSIEIQTFENNTYYLKYRVYIKTVKSSSNNWAIYALQFYGRELSVSVPKMATNSSPYGEAKCSHVTSGYDAYKAFDGDDSTGWYYTSTTAGLTPTVEYDFVKPIEIAKIFAILATGSSRALTGKAKLQYYDISDNTWKDLTEELDYTSNGSYYYIDLPSSIHTDKVRYICITPPVYEGKYLYGYVFTLQFYGKDYSEREFEEGSTKKWLYDHGVELEEITTFNTSSASVVKNSDSIVYSANGTSSDTTCAGFRTTNKINLSPYSLARLAVGKIVNIGTSILLEDNAQFYVGLTPEAAIFLAANILPRDISLDVSSVNQERYVQAAVYRNGLATEAVEMWLE